MKVVSCYIPFYCSKLGYLFGRADKLVSFAASIIADLKSCSSKEAKVFIKKEYEGCPILALNDFQIHIIESDLNHLLFSTALEKFDNFKISGFEEVEYEVLNDDIYNNYETCPFWVDENE